MALHPDAHLIALQKGQITLKGQFMWGSNYTFLVEVQHDNTVLPAVYKPTRGERPLWDFPTASLAHREAAAYLVSEMLGWQLVPPTIYRRRAPLGPGSLQQFIEHDPQYHFFNMTPEDRQRLRPVVVFDLLINNADRKGSHILRDPRGRLWLIDHGICFHVEDKLRSVIWDFAGETIPADLLSDVERLRQTLTTQPEGIAELEKHLRPTEIRALLRRAEALLANPLFPAPDPSRRPFPWPPV